MWQQVIGAWLKRTLDQCRKALDRDRGPTTRTMAVRVETWAVDKLQAKSGKKGAPFHTGLMFLWAAVWMLREIEAEARKNDQEKWAAIRLATSKNE